MIINQTPSSPEEGATSESGSPRDWSPRTLGELETSGVLFVKNGFSCGTHQTNGGGVPHLRPFNVTEDGRLSFKGTKTIPYRPGMEEYALQCGDILYNNTNSEELVGKCAYWLGRNGLHVLSNHMTILRITDPREVDPRFLAFHLFWFWVIGSARMFCRRHVNQASIGLQRLRQIVVHCPAPAEQRAIAGVLANIQAAVEVQQKIVATLKELKAATMAKLFREGLRGEPLKQTEIGEIPQTWAVVSVGSVCRHINYGTSVRCGVEPNGRPVLRIPNIVREGVDTTDLKWAELPDGEASKVALEPGDLLFVRTNGNKEYLGRCAVYEGDPANALFASYLIRVRLESGTLLPAFVRAYLSSLGREQITAKAHAASDGKYNIDTGVLKSVLVPQPSLVEQQTIVETLATVDQRLKVAQERAQRAKSLLSSMLHLLMTGRVRVTRKMIALQAVADRAARRPKWSGKVAEKVLEEVVKRIVEAVAPEKIILFGSAARGEMGPDSDLDLLVVKACENTREVARTIRRQLIRIGVPKDVVVVTPEDVEEYKDIPGYVIGPALKEGKVLYAA